MNLSNIVKYVLYRNKEQVPVIQDLANNDYRVPVTNDASLVSNTGGAVVLATGLSAPKGVYIAVFTTAGTLKVTLPGSSATVVLPFFVGWNPVLVTSIVGGDSANTAVGVYYGI